jgi:hypothetical protein
MPQESKISVAIIRQDRYMKIKSKDFWGCENARYIAGIATAGVILIGFEIRRG